MLLNTSEKSLNLLISALQALVRAKQTNTYKKSSKSYLSLTVSYLESILTQINLILNKGLLIHVTVFEEIDKQDHNYEVILNGKMISYRSNEKPLELHPFTDHLCGPSFIKEIKISEKTK